MVVNNALAWMSGKGEFDVALFTALDKYFYAVIQKYCVLLTSLSVKQKSQVVNKSPCIVTLLTF